MYTKFDAYCQDLSFSWQERFDADMSGLSYGRLIFKVNGVRIAHSDFSTLNPPRDMVENRKVEMVKWMLNNPRFRQYRPAFFHFFALRGITVK